MIKILFIHHAKGIGGAPISMINIIKELDRSKFEPVVLLLKNSEVANLLKHENIPYITPRNKFYLNYYKYYSHSKAGYIKWYEIHRLLINSVCWILSRYIFSFIILKDLDFDIIHLNSSVLTDWLYAAKRKGKTIIHIREPFSSGYLGIRKWFFTRQMKKYADHIIAISNDNACRINIPGKTTVIYNFTEIPNVVTIQNNHKDNKVVLYLGGDAVIKGFYTLVDSLKYIDSGIKVLFAGTYSSSERKKGIKKYFPWNRKHHKALLTMRNSLNTEELGLIKDVSLVIKEVDVLVSPFSVEHFSRPIIEAFAYKKAVIGTDVEGMNEIIDHKINGLIVEKNNPKELAYAINLICSDSKIAREMGENGYRKAQKIFSPSNIRSIEDIYLSLYKNKQ